MKYKYLEHNLRLLCFINKVTEKEVSIELFNDENKVTDIIDGSSVTKEEAYALSEYFEVPIETFLSNNSNELLKHFGHNIRLLCIANNVKQKDLSIEVCDHENRISDIIGNKPIRITEYEIEAIAEYFKKPVKTLVYKKAYVDFK